MKSRRILILIVGSLGIIGSVLGCSQAGTATDTTNPADEDVDRTFNTLGADPGPRGGPAAAGGFFPTLNADEQALFETSLEVFEEVDSVSGTIPEEEGRGLGPTFNGNGCAQCHAQPAVGGSSPGLRSPQHPIPNPQVALATLDGATNVVPAFITADGPVREARFVATSNRSDAPLDGSVHGLYTIKGRTDAVGCNLAQPDFAAQLAQRNVVFRIPTPLFGLGLVENTSDLTLQANLDANSNAKKSLGITGHLNTSGNDQTVTKFGWKAQNKSLLIFAGEAYNVEQGVANELFTNERSAVPGCVFNKTPEDPTTTNNGASDVVQFAIFMRFAAPPTPATLSASAQRGSELFDSVGCANCHSRSLTTDASPFTGMSNVTYHPFSDFALHHMGATLADGVHQGAAGADEFRTAPLWGVGQRLFFLHDGRTSDLGAAIQAHASPGRRCVTTDDFEQFSVDGRTFEPSSHTHTCGSEANQVVSRFNRLRQNQQTDLLNFLRAL